MDYFLWYKTPLYGDSLHSTSSCVISLEKKPNQTLASEKNVQGSVEASQDQKVSAVPELCATLWIWERSCCGLDLNLFHNL